MLVTTYISVLFLSSPPYVIGNIIPYNVCYNQHNRGQKPWKSGKSPTLARRKQGGELPYSDVTGGADKHRSREGTLTSLRRATFTPSTAPPPMSSCNLVLPRPAAAQASFTVQVGRSSNGPFSDPIYCPGFTEIPVRELPESLSRNYRTRNQLRAAPNSRHYDALHDLRNKVGADCLSNPPISRKISATNWSKR